MSSREFRGDRLDVATFAKDAATLSGELPIASFPRLCDSMHQPGNVHGAVTWTAHGRTVAQRGGAFETWIDLRAHGQFDLTCQVCLDAAPTPIEVERSFRFVATEQLAAELDETSEDDVLVSSRNFDLLSLLEDELLLALPLVPRHEICPAGLPAPADDDFVQPEAHDPTDAGTSGADPPHPFAALQGLKSGPH
jgi:uncharacterized protein